MLIKRGDLFWVNLDSTQGSEQAGRRPVNVHLPRGVAGLTQPSTILLSQIRTIDKSRLERKIGHLPPERLRQVNEAIAISLGLTL